MSTASVVGSPLEFLTHEPKVKQGEPPYNKIRVVLPQEGEGNIPPKSHMIAPMAWPKSLPISRCGQVSMPSPQSRSLCAQNQAPAGEHPHGEGQSRTSHAGWEAFGMSQQQLGGQGPRSPTATRSQDRGGRPSWPFWKVAWSRINSLFFLIALSL